jgi:hypothetical protein
MIIGCWCGTAWSTPCPAAVDRQDYRRWQREVPMGLWQLDIVDGVRPADGLGN